MQIRGKQIRQLLLYSSLIENNLPLEWARKMKICTAIGRLTKLRYLITYKCITIAITVIAWFCSSIWDDYWRTHVASRNRTILANNPCFNCSCPIIQNND